MTDEQIYERHVNGDATAFPELRERYRAQLIRFFAESAADDATEEGMVKIGLYPEEETIDLRKLGERLADQTLDLAARHHEVFCRQRVLSGMYAIATRVNRDALVTAVKERWHEQNARTKRILSNLGFVETES